MTEREFAWALRRGLGSAILALQKDAANAVYRDVLLRACLRNLAYDWQSEGTKGFYLYTAIRATGDGDFFERAVIDRFLHRCRDELFFQLADILACFASDGSAGAQEAFHTKYAYFAKKKGRLVKSRRMDEGFQWEELGCTLFDLDGFSAFKRYALDAGAILRDQADPYCLYYDVFISKAEWCFGKRRVHRFLDTMYGKSTAIKALMDTLRAQEEYRKRFQAEHEALQEKEFTTLELTLEAARKAALDEYPLRSMSRYRGFFKMRASESAWLALAQAALLEEDETVKAALLWPLFGKPFPLDIAPLLLYAQSDHELLQEAAIACLQETRDRRIHDLALSLLARNGFSSFALGLLQKNYQKSDDRVIWALLKKTASADHNVEMDIKDIYRLHRSKDAFPILYRFYQRGLCSHCRYGIVRAMRHCGVLPDSVLEECLHDSYEDTRTYAKRIAAGRRRAGEGTP